MSDFIVKGDFTNFNAASVAAGTDFAHINIDLSNAPRVDIYNLELSVFTDTLDEPNLSSGALRIFRNILVDPDRSLAVQIGSQGVTTFWEARNSRTGDHNISRIFSDPITLDPGFRYSITGIFGFSAVLNAVNSVDLFMSGRVVTEQPDLYFGQTR